MITSCNHSTTEQLCGSCREKNHRQSILDDKDAEVSSLRTELAALKDAVRPVVWAWKIHGHEEYPSDTLIAALDALAALVGEE